MEREPGFLEQLEEDGRPALMLTAVALLISGAFAVFLSARREFLPHDVAFLGMTAKELCGLADCRVVRFMFHDRVAFGDRKSTRLNSSHSQISYAVFCL